MQLQARTLAPARLPARRPRTALGAPRPSAPSLLAEPTRLVSCVQPALRLQDVGVGDVQLNVALYPGEIVHLSGGSASARLRVLAMAAGFDPCGSGRCEVLGLDLQDLDGPARRALRERDIGRVLGCDHLAGAVTVLALVALPLVRQGCALADARARAELELGALGCEHLAERAPETLDASESRLVLLARAMVARPRLLVLEHPEQHLPPVAVSAVRLSLWSLSSAFGTCVLMSTEHPRLIASADRYIDLDRRG